MGSGIGRENVETFSKDVFQFGEARIECGGKGAEVGILGAGGVLDCMEICLVSRDGE